MKSTISISIEPTDLATIDRARGDVPRSIYMVKASLAKAAKSAYQKESERKAAKIDEAIAKAHPEGRE